jgi:hypothetical protein
MKHAIIEVVIALTSLLGILGIITGMVKPVNRSGMLIMLGCALILIVLNHAPPPWREHPRYMRTKDLWRGLILGMAVFVLIDEISDRLKR